MEGRGVTNYAVDKPSFAFSTSTTEFDDALMQRGIVTLEQCMAAKGASTEETQRLVRVKQGVDVGTAPKQCNDSNDDSDDSYLSDDDDDDFLEQYRAMRLSQLRRKQPSFGQVIPISRPEWTKQVNEASQETWVVVTLTSMDTELTGCVEASVSELALKFDRVKFVSIPSRQAIANWPESNLPCIFLYRHGKLQHELVRMRSDMTADLLEWTLAQSNVLETELEDEPKSKDFSAYKYSSTSTFSGTMAQLATRGNSDDENDNYDE